MHQKHQAGLYFGLDENFIYPLLQVGSGSGAKKYWIRQAKSQRIRPNPDPHSWLEHQLNNCFVCSYDLLNTRVFLGFVALCERIKASTQVTWIGYVKLI